MFLDFYELHKFILTSPAVLVVLLLAFFFHPLASYVSFAFPLVSNPLSNVFANFLILRYQTLTLIATPLSLPQVAGRKNSPRVLR